MHVTRISFVQIEKIVHCTIVYRTAGTFREVYFSRAKKRRENRINSHAPVFHIQSYWWVWFPGIETQILEPMNISAEGSVAKINMHP